MKKIFLGMMAITMALSFTACQDGLDNIILDGVGGLNQSCRDSDPPCDNDLVCTGGVCLSRIVPPPLQKHKALSRIDYYTLNASKNILHGAIEISYDEEGRLVAAKESLGERGDETLSPVEGIKFEYDTENRPVTVSHHVGPEDTLTKKVLLTYGREGVIEEKEAQDSKGKTITKITYRPEFTEASENAMVKKLIAVFNSGEKATQGISGHVLQGNSIDALAVVDPPYIFHPLLGTGIRDNKLLILNEPLPPNGKTSETQYQVEFSDNRYIDSAVPIDIKTLTPPLNIPPLEQWTVPIDIKPPTPPLKIPPRERLWVEFSDSGLPVQFADGYLKVNDTVNVIYHDEETRLSKITLVIPGSEDKTVLEAEYSPEGRPVAVSEWDNKKEFDIVPTFDEQGVLVKEDIKEKEKSNNHEQRIFQYIELDKEPITPPIAWIQSIMDHSSTLYIDTPEKLFGRWMFISVE